ncbi:hypothetical protein TNCT_476041 [Trichonephila clavata]|uniref:Uncharacterized protein n=1 Tax=Trichonephila clavata TaxID=2740835 RepID=A0A8X6F4V0_TRICU|nr:hypothetical protein TNCT_476041 [Trichonephila clavata]
MHSLANNQSINNMIERNAEDLIDILTRIPNYSLWPDYDQNRELNLKSQRGSIQCVRDIESSKSINNDLIEQLSFINTGDFMVFDVTRLHILIRK